MSSSSSATETDIEIVLWIQIVQSKYGLALRLLVDIRTLYVFGYSFVFQWYWSILCLFFSFWYENNNISNISRRGGWTGLGMA